MPKNVFVVGEQVMDPFINALNHGSSDYKFKLVPYNLTSPLLHSSS